MSMGERLKKTMKCGPCACGNADPGEFPNGIFSAGMVVKQPGVYEVYTKCQCGRMMVDSFKITYTGRSYTKKIIKELWEEYEKEILLPRETKLSIWDIIKFMMPKFGRKIQGNSNG